MKNLIPTLVLAFALAGAAVDSASAATPPATPPTTPTSFAPGYVSATGAVSSNAAYEAGQSATWLPEYQRLGADYVEAGIQQENPAIISQGLLILDWAWKRQAADGSFTGCGNPPLTATNASGALGNIFHSTSLFFEAGARACIDLQNYHPVTYQLDPNTYGPKIAGYSTQLALTAQWLTNTSWTPPGASAPVSVPGIGYIYDSAFSHRYALLSAGMQECSVVTGNSNLITETYGANWWLDQLFPRQLGNGWTAAIPASTVAGGNTPASLLAPGTAAPVGTGKVISAVGVLPEESGYDVSYHMVDCLHSSRWYNASQDAARKAQMVTLLTSALAWERTLQAVDGSIDTTGSRRIGVETNQNGGGIKNINAPEIIKAFTAGGIIDGQRLDTLGGLRLASYGKVPNTDAVDSQGAVGSNIAYDTHASNAYNIGTQKDCADWVQGGIQLENDAQINQGILIMQWGFARQAADGSFPLTGSRYTDTCTFIEAAARTVLMLQSYAPLSHPLDQSLLATIPADIAAINLSASYLLNPTLIAGYAGTWSGSRLLTYAAALGEAAVVTSQTNPAGSTAYQAQANAFLAQALAAQLPDGTFPENGAFIANAQATSVCMLGHCFTMGAFSSNLKAQMLTAMRSGLAKLEPLVNIDGTFAFASPSIPTLRTAFQLGATVTGDARDTVIYQRIANSGLGIS